MHLAILSIPASVSETDLERLGPALDGLNVGYYASKEIEGDETSPWLMRWIVEVAPNVADFTLRLNIWARAQEIEFTADENDWTIEVIKEDTDWLAQSYQGFQPFTLSNFFIYGSHYEGALPEDLIPLQIDAATAFGSGEHPTTAGCLEFLYELYQNDITPKNILDMGCGSGILAIAAAKLWPKSAITAIDIDEESIVVTQRHEVMNHLESGHIACEAGNGFHSDLAKSNAPYDLIIANILAGPLKEMAADLAATLEQSGDKNSHVILSGLLNEQAEDIFTTYASHSVLKKDHKEIKEWSALLLRN